MAYKTLGKIAKSAVLRKEFSMHWYLPFLKHTCDCYRELLFGILDAYETVVLPVDADGSVELPCNYAAWVRVGYMNGGLTYPLVQQDNINALRNPDGKGGFKDYDAPDVFLLRGLGYYNPVVTQWGSFYGGFFGYGNGYQVDTFRELKGQNRIQINQGLGITELYLEYKSDGTGVSNATKVTPLAQACLEAYCFWQMKLDTKENFTEQFRLLRSRLDPITTDDIRRIWNNNYYDIPNH